MKSFSMAEVMGIVSGALGLVSQIMQLCNDDDKKPKVDGSWGEFYSSMQAMDMSTLGVTDPVKVAALDQLRSEVLKANPNEPLSLNMEGVKDVVRSYLQKQQVSNASESLYQQVEGLANKYVGLQAVEQYRMDAAAKQLPAAYLVPLQKTLPAPLQLPVSHQNGK